MGALVLRLDGSGIATKTISPDMDVTTTTWTLSTRLMPNNFARIDLASR